MRRPRFLASFSELEHLIRAGVKELCFFADSFDRRKVDYVWRLGKNGQPMIEFLNKELAEFTLVRMRVSKDYVSYSGGFKGNDDYARSIIPMGGG